ncbi:hypothetical protein TKK_0007163 [Trichogramma kaykai]|uniref:Uncharacterized protein n=1 Tax=Trichogramma kaykai TaxID=54128 RepID=A0ABD2X9T3_9HYME
MFATERDVVIFVDDNSRAGDTINNQLCRAVRDRRDRRGIERLARLAAENVNRGSRDASRRTALHHAVATRYREAVELLLFECRDVDPNSYDGYGSTALHLAVASQDTRLVLPFLLHPRTRLAATQARTRQSVLHMVVRDRNEAMLRLLLAFWSGHPVDLRNEAEDTPLHLAAGVAGDDPKFLEILLGRGADCSLSNIWNQTPVHVAVARNNFKCLKSLIEHSSSEATASSPNLVTPLKLAVKYNNARIVEYLLNRQSQPESCLLHEAVTSSSDELLKMLLKWPGIDKEEKNIDGQTPLHLAILTKSLEKTRLLLEHGVKATDPETIVRAVRARASRRMFELLIEAGADVNAKNDDNETPLEVAARMRSATTIGILLKLGADPLCLANDRSLLHEAIRVADHRFCDFLLANFDEEIDVNYVDSAGDTSLTLAGNAPISTIRALVRKLAIVGPNDRNRKAIDENQGFKEHYEECRLELKRLNEEGLIKVLVTSRSWRKATFSRINRIEARVKDGKRLEEYPIYQEKLATNLERMRERREWMKRTHEALVELETFHVLFDVIETIVDNFTNKEMMYFLKNCG